MAYYKVTDNSDPKIPKHHLVNAKNKGQALSAVVEPRFTVEAASDTDLITLTKNGVEVIDADKA